MTNKINGIDVSEWELKGVLIPITECKYFEGIGDCRESKGLCVANDNCYFKQLKRLQKENEELGKIINCKTGTIQSLAKVRDDLKQENEELKKEKMNINLINLDYEAKISYLIQTLKEIREIAKFNQFYNPEKLIINGDIGQIQNLKMTEIYNKINEVLND